MSSTKSKLRLVGAFAVLASLALAVGCRGFFVNPTIASFVISPTNPTVLLGGTTQMHAFGTDSNGNPTGDITSKITWSSTESGLISISPAGLLSGLKLNTTPVQIDANYQALAQQSTTANTCVATNTVVNGSFQLVPANNTQVSSSGVFPNGGMTASLEAQVDATTETLDVTAAASWASNNTNMTITNGVSPATVSIGTPVTTNTNVLVTATYSCNGASLSQSVTIILTP